MSSAYFPPASTPTLANGNVIYACALPRDSSHMLPPAVWVTQDGGSHWKLGALPAANGAQDCTIVTDDTDASVAVVMIDTLSSGSKPIFGPWAVTFDAGSTWQPTSGNILQQMVSRNGLLYAIRDEITGSVAHLGLWATSDGMRTWRRVDHNLPDDIMHFWLRPASKEILAEIGTGSAKPKLWQSEDDGATWSAISSPTVDGFVVQPSIAAQPWHICGSAFDDSSSSNLAPNSLLCSTDGGRTWQTCNALNHLLAPGQVGSTTVLAIAYDGAVLARAADTVDASGAITEYTLYRLPLGGIQWQPMGKLPQFAVYSCNAPGAGFLWATAAPEMLLDPQNRIFSVSYPG